MGATHFEGPVISENGFEDSNGTINPLWNVLISAGSLGNSESRLFVIPIPIGYTADVVRCQIGSGTVTNDPTFQLGDSYGGGDIVTVATIAVTSNVMNCTISSTAPTVASGGIIYGSILCDADDAILAATVSIGIQLTAV